MIFTEKKECEKNEPTKLDKYDIIFIFQHIIAFKSMGTIFVVSIVAIDTLSRNQRLVKSHPDSAADAIS